MCSSRASPPRTASGKGAFAVRQSSTSPSRSAHELAAANQALQAEIAERSGWRGNFLRLSSVSRRSWKRCRWGSASRMIQPASVSRATRPCWRNSRCGPGTIYPPPHRTRTHRPTGAILPRRVADRRCRASFATGRRRKPDDSADGIGYRIAQRAALVCGSLRLPHTR